jgi:hypothetical protein
MCMFTRVLQDATRPVHHGFRVLLSRYRALFGGLGRPLPFGCCDQASFGREVEVGQRCGYDSLAASANHGKLGNRL